MYVVKAKMKCRFEVRNEREYGTEMQPEKECIGQKNKDKINTICFVSGTTDGWWGKSVV